MGIAPNRWKVKQLVDEVCRRQNQLVDGQPHYRGLSLSYGLSATTIPNMLEHGDRLPDWRTLKALADKSEVPLIEWLLALDVITPGDMAAALKQRRPPALLSAAQRAALDLVKTWPDDEALRYLEWLRQSPPIPEPDSSRE